MQFYYMFFALYVLAYYTFTCVHRCLCTVQFNDGVMMLVGPFCFCALRISCVSGTSHQQLLFSPNSLKIGRYIAYVIQKKPINVNFFPFYFFNEK